MPKASKDIKTLSQLERALDDIINHYAIHYGDSLGLMNQMHQSQPNPMLRLQTSQPAKSCQDKLERLINQLTKAQLSQMIQGRPSKLEKLLSLAPSATHGRLIGLLKDDISKMSFKSSRLKSILKKTKSSQHSELLSHIGPTIISNLHNRHIIYILKRLPEGKRLDFLKENRLLDGSHGARPLPNPARSSFSPYIPFAPLISGIHTIVKADKRDDLLWKNCRYYFNVLALLPKNQRLDYLKSLSPQFKKMIAGSADEYARFHTDIKSHYGYFDEKDRLKVVNILQESNPTYISRKAGTILKHLPDKQIPGFIKKHAEDLYKYVTGAGASYTYLLKCVDVKHHDVLKKTITATFQEHLDKRSNKKLYDMFLRNKSIKSISTHFDRVHKDFTKFHLIAFVRAKLYELSHQHTAHLHKSAISAPKKAYETLLDAVQKDDPEIIRKYLMKDNKGSYPDDKLFQILCAHVISPAPSKRDIKQRSPSS